MKNRRLFMHVLGCLVAGFMLAYAWPVFGGSYAIRNATIIPVTGPEIVGGTLVIEGEKITAIGRDVPVPQGAEVIDAAGLYVYPGMIDGGTALGLMEVYSVPATVDIYEVGTYKPHIKALVAVNPHSVHIPISRVNGITSAVVSPGGGVISGQFAILNLNGWTPEEMAIKASAGIAINFPRLPREDGRRQRPGQQQQEGGKERTEKQIKELTELFHKAGRYAATWEAYDPKNKQPAPDKDLILEALVPVVKGELPAIIAVNAEQDIKNAVEFVDSLGIKAIFQGVTDGWKAAKLLKKHDIPCFVGPVLSLPGNKDPYDARYANAAALHKAGVKVAIISGSVPDVRNLPYMAGTASAFGLPREEALKAVTINPAEILGVSDLIGSLEVGKMANVIITDGDPLQMRTHVKQVFIAGEKISMESKHTKSYEKFRKR